MPVVKLGGRLGNQLFQVAFGIAQSLRSNQPLLFDCDGLSEEQIRFLEDWVGPIRHAPPATVVRLKGKASFKGKVYRGLQRLLPFHYRSWVLQSSSSFQSSYLGPRQMTYFDGYWQSYRYFLDVAVTVRSSFSCRASTNAVIQTLIEQVRRGETVSIHVRRGDYVASGVFGVVPETFYSQAIDQLLEEVPIEQIYVFSDDPKWCQDHLSLGLPFQVVEGNTPPIDLMLMSLCKHHIISTSTFSWWGAWLGQDQSGRVIAPRSWFSSYGKTPPLSDIYPKEWLLL